MRSSIATNGIRRAQQLPWLTPVEGTFVSPTIANDGISAAPGAAGRLELFPFTVRGDFDLQVKNFALGCPNAVAGATVRFIVYASDIYGRPHKLRYQSEDVSLATTGLKLSQGGMLMRMGATYWLGLHHSSTASVNTVFYSATPDINGGADLGIRKTLRRTVAYGSAPLEWGYSGAEGNSAAAPAIILKV